MEPNKTSGIDTNNILRINFEINNDVFRESAFSDDMPELIPDIYDIQEPIHQDTNPELCNMWT